MNTVITQDTCSGVRPSRVLLVVSVVRVRLHPSSSGIFCLQDSPEVFQRETVKLTLLLSFMFDLIVCNKNMEHK